MPRQLVRRKSAVPVPAPEDIARRRADEIRCALADAAETYAQAVLERDWETLGYGSPAEWASAEFAQTKWKPAARKEITSMLTAEGLPLREIAALTGSSPVTVMRDQRESGVSNETQASPRQAAARKREEAKRSSGIGSLDEIRRTRPAGALPGAGARSGTGSHDG